MKHKLFVAFLVLWGTASLLNLVIFAIDQIRRDDFKCVESQNVDKYQAEVRTLLCR